MKHRVGYNRLGRKPSHRKSLHRNMVTSLFKHERIRTTKAKARAIRRTAEKMITRAKVDSVHNRRIVGKDLKDKAVLAKLFVDIAPRFKERPGGYTRMLKIGPRAGDAAEMVLLELVGEMKSETSSKAKRGESTKKSATAKSGKTAKEDSRAKKDSKAKAPKAEPVEADADDAAEAVEETAPAEVAIVEETEVEQADEAPADQDDAVAEAEESEDTEK